MSCCLISGRNHPAFAEQLSLLLQIPLSETRIVNFPSQEIHIEILENVKNRDIYLIQSLSPNVQEAFLELLFLIDAFKRAQSRSITLCVPYLSYMRKDRSTERSPGLPSRMMADLFQTAGATRLITLDMHDDRILGFYTLPVSQLSSAPILISCMKELCGDFVLVAPDRGRATYVKAIAQELNKEYVIFEKHREFGKTYKSFFYGSVKNKPCVIIDDILDTGQTLYETCIELKKAGALQLFAFITHGVLSPKAFSLLEKIPLQTLFLSDSICYPAHPLIQSFSVAPLFAQAIREIISYSN